MFPVVYDRNVARESRSGSYSGSKRGTKGGGGGSGQVSSSSGGGTGGGGGGSSTSSHGGGGGGRYVKKEAATQLSPVKKRIKETKDHYIVADHYRTTAAWTTTQVL